MSKAISPSEVSAHSGDVWIIVDGSVYDMSGFLDEHPGGSKILKRMGGKDASKQFWKVCHNSSTLIKRYRDPLVLSPRYSNALLIASHFLLYIVFSGSN